MPPKLRFYTPKQAVTTPVKKSRKKLRVGIQGQPTAVHMPIGYMPDEEHHPAGYNAMVRIVGHAEQRMGIDPHFTPHASPTYRHTLPPPPSPQSPIKRKRPRRSSIGVKGTQGNNALLASLAARAASADLRTMHTRRRINRK